MNISDCRLYDALLRKAEDSGFKVDLGHGEVITLRANKKKLPRYAEGVVVFTFATVDGVLGWLSGWCAGEMYAREEGRCRHAKRASKKTKSSTKKASARRVKGRSPRRIR